MARLFFFCGDSSSAVLFWLKAEQSNGNLEELQQDRCKSARSEVRPFGDMKQFFSYNKKVILSKDVKLFFHFLEEIDF